MPRSEVNDDAKRLTCVFAVTPRSNHRIVEQIPNKSPVDRRSYTLGGLVVEPADDVLVDICSDPHRRVPNLVGDDLEVDPALQGDRRGGVSRVVNAHPRQADLASEPIELRVDPPIGDRGAVLAGEHQVGVWYAPKVARRS
jgi:hypothetical protein